MRPSSIRPRKTTVGAAVRPGSGRAPWKRDTSTPLGMSTASPPRCSTTTRRAAGDTAIRPVIFSSAGCSAVPKTCRARERAIAVWNVATIGPLAANVASIDTLGTVGSCTCSTSNSPSRSQRRVRASDSGPKTSRATEPL